MTVMFRSLVVRILLAVSTMTMIVAAVVVLRQPGLPPLSSDGIPVPFGSATVLKGSVINIGTRGDTRIIDAVWEGEESLSLEPGAMHFLLTREADNVPSGTTLHDALGDSPFIAYAYVTENAEVELERRSLLSRQEAVNYRELFPGTFVANRSVRATDFQNVHPDVTFVEPSSVTITSSMRILIIPETSSPIDFRFAPTSVCGNQIVEPPEECDDGNQTDGDGCSGNCTTEHCGVYPNSGTCCSACNGGAIGGTCTGSADTCCDQCATPTCGNQIVEPPEECDDGNQTDGDGCSGNCTTESGIHMTSSSSDSSSSISIIFGYEGTFTSPSAESSPSSSSSDQSYIPPYNSSSSSSGTPECKPSACHVNGTQTSGGGMCPIVSQMQCNDGVLPTAAGNCISLFSGCTGTAYSCLTQQKKDAGIACCPGNAS
ncbi:MAG: DUF4215 domain-containing protein [Candidatus Peribacteraceae bacterium]|nr:DUF4215 domain-containing protein [Candidatus Peribacteraceae bacterium]